MDGSTIQEGGDDASALRRSPEPPSELGRFDRSFFVRMIVSFVVFLVAVAALELGLRFAFAVRSFDDEGPRNVETAARQLAGDVRTIMINRGGPVASRTVYPILDRTFERGGLDISIEPSPLTVESIERSFGFTPRGLPADFPAGAHHESRVELRADDACLQCHVTASIGDVLGTVTVREYRSARLDGWWEDVRLSLTLNVVKIVVHTVILFFLLRLVMAPLLSLRGAVGRLARGTGGLSVRAEVRSSDEFGELAADLNAFLDRVNDIVRDLRRTISRMVAANTRLAAVIGDVEAQVGRVESALQATVRSSRGARAAPRALDRLPRLMQEIHDLKHMVREIDFLEDHLRDVADSGRSLLDRLLEDEK